MTKTPSSVSGPDRRVFLSKGLVLLAAGTLALAYGMFGSFAARFLYPARPRRKDWLFVKEANRVKPGESVRYRAPSGEWIQVTRKGETGAAADFIALSSTCPHLGCQVKWEEHNRRFFCPCHNGVFTPEGIAIAGPPGEAGQRLAQYPLKVDKGMLFVQVPVEGILLAKTRPGHDPVLLKRWRKAVVQG